VLGALAARAARRGRVSAGLAAAVAAADLSWRGRRPGPEAAGLAAAVASATQDGDPVAARLIERWCGRVTAAVAEECARLGLGETPAVIVYGGLGEASPWLAARIRAAVLTGAPGARFATSTREPVDGAALLAREAWSGDLAPWDFVPRR